MTRPGPRSLYNGLVCFIASFVWPTQFFKCKWKALSITVLLLCEKLAGAEASLEEKSQKTKRTKKERESERVPTCFCTRLCQMPAEAAGRWQQRLFLQFISIQNAIEMVLWLQIGRMFDYQSNFNLNHINKLTPQRRRLKKNKIKNVNGVS